MWSIKLIQEKCEELSKKMGDYFDCPISINGRLTRTLGKLCFLKKDGQCFYNELQFSKQLLETATDESIISVIEHEWCHYYVMKQTLEDHGHDSYFKAICKKIGCSNDGVSTKVNRILSEDQVYKYSVYCNTCKSFVCGYSRMNKTLKNLSDCTCKKCNTKNLTYTKNW